MVGVGGVAAVAEESAGFIVDRLGRAVAVFAALGPAVPVPPGFFGSDRR